MTSPLLANIALSVLDEHFARQWNTAMSSYYQRSQRRRNGLGNWRLVRYADDFVLLVSGDRHVVLFIGLPAQSEAEGSDRTTIDLPDQQLALIAALAATPARTVVALSNSSAVTTATWRHGVDAIVEFWLTGQAHGDTIADVLLGDINPAGKLAESIPIRLADTPSFLDFPGENGAVRYSEGIHVGYRYYDARDLAVAAQEPVAVWVFRSGGGDPCGRR